MQSGIDNNLSLIVFAVREIFSIPECEDTPITRLLKLICNAGGELKNKQIINSWQQHEDMGSDTCDLLSFIDSVDRWIKTNVNENYGLALIDDNVVGGLKLTDSRLRENNGNKLEGLDTAELVVILQQMSGDYKNKKNKEPKRVKKSRSQRKNALMRR